MSDMLSREWNFSRFQILLLNPGLFLRRWQGGRDPILNPGSADVHPKCLASLVVGVVFLAGRVVVAIRLDALHRELSLAMTGILLLGHPRRGSLGNAEF